MKSNPFKELFAILLMDKSAIKFALGVLFGYAFSIAVILSTVGIMDGFSTALKEGLRSSDGDVTIYSRSGFFDFKKDVDPYLKNLDVENYSSFIQTEGFLINDKLSKGVLVRGVESESYAKVTPFKIDLGPDEISLGRRLAKDLDLDVGDYATLALAKGSKNSLGLPGMERFKVKSLIDHKIFQKDERIAYLNKQTAARLLSLEDRSNMVTVLIPQSNELYIDESVNFMDKVREFMRSVQSEMGFTYIVRPFWSEYSGLIKAVETEKFVISLILQIVVIISIFNVLAFIIFLNEKRAREIFLFRALGMSNKTMRKGWLTFTGVVWAIACAISFLMVKLFSFALTKFSLFQLPRDVYTLGRIDLVLGADDYIIVFILAYLWLLVTSWIALKRIDKKSILVGLRKEFA